MNPMCKNMLVTRRHQSPASVKRAEFAPQCSNSAVVGSVIETPASAIPRNTATLIPKIPWVTVRPALVRIQGWALLAAQHLVRFRRAVRLRVAHTKGTAFYEKLKERAAGRIGDTSPYILNRNEQFATVSENWGKKNALTRSRSNGSSISALQ